jgi:hypothetical protein
MNYVGKWRFRNLRTPLFKKERNLPTFTAPNGLQSLASNCNLVYATPGLGFKVYDWKKSLESKPLDNIYIWLCEFHAMQLWFWNPTCFYVAILAQLIPLGWGILGSDHWLHGLQPRQKGCLLLRFAHTSCGGTQLRFLRATESQYQYMII